METAKYFYPHAETSEKIMRYVLETIVVERADDLLKNSKYGLNNMIKEADQKHLKTLY